VWDVSERFLQALRGPHKLVTEATVTVPGGDPVDVRVKAGSISADSSSRVRRSGSMVVQGGADVFALVSTPGAVFRVYHGIDFGSTTELVPVFTGELSSPVQQVGVGEVRVTLADLGERVSRCRFLAPFSPAGSTRRVDVIAAVVADAVPAATVVDSSTDVGTVGGGKVWDENRWDVITDLALDGQSEAFFAADGSFRLRDAPSMTSSPVWTVNAGDGGVLISAARERPLDRLFNTVVVRPSATDGSQSWTQQVVSVEGPGSPLAPDVIGTVPFFFASPSASTAEAARAAGLRILRRVVGLTESLAIECVANPALEINDVIRVITPSTEVDSAQAFQHFVDSFSFDLASGRMSIQTRLQGVQID
jgi:hypothetical protein